MWSSASASASQQPQKMIISRSRYCSNAWSHQIILALILILNQIQYNFGSPVFSNSIAHFQSGRNIRNLPCVVRRSGQEGICMFAIDCIKANGTHLGTCIDRFYFGSCCQLKSEAGLVAPDVVENSIDQNTISHYPPSPSTSSYYAPTTTSLRPTHKTSTPSVTRRTTATPRRPTPTKRVTHAPTTSTSGRPSSSSSIRPSSSSVKPSSSSSSSSSSSVSPSITSIGTSSSSTTNKLESSTVQYVPITTLLYTESKTESSSEQHTLDKLTSSSFAPMPTTSRDEVLTRLPATTTEETMKLQTFQSIQETTLTPLLSSSSLSSSSSSSSSTSSSTYTPTHPSTTPKRTTPSTSSRPSARPTANNKNPPANKPTFSSSTSTSVYIDRPTPTANKKPIKPSKQRTTTRRPTATTPHRRTTIITTPAHSTSTQFESSRRPSNVSSTTAEPLVTASYVETTKAPRPRPKPTAEITTVPPTDLSYLVESKTTPTFPPSSTTVTSKRPSSPTPHSSTLPVASRTTPGSSTSKATSAPTTSTSTTTTTASTTTKPVITTRPPGLTTWTNFAENSIDDSESTETPGEWILIPSVTPASTPPSILVASPITGVITKRPLPTTASPMRNHTTPFAHSSTASRPKPTVNSRPPPPLPPSSFEPEPTTRFPTRRPITKPSSIPSSSLSSLLSSLSSSVPTKPVRITTQQSTTLSMAPNKIASTAPSALPSTLTTNSFGTATAVDVDMMTTEAFDALQTELDSESLVTTDESFTQFTNQFDQTTITEFSETEHPSYGTTIPKLNMTASYVDAASSSSPSYSSSPSSFASSSSSSTSAYTTTPMHSSSMFASRPTASVPLQETTASSSPITVITNPSTASHGKVNATYSTSSSAMPTRRPSTTLTPPTQASMSTWTSADYSSSSAFASMEPLLTTAQEPIQMTTMTYTSDYTTPFSSSTARQPETTLPNQLDNVTSEATEQYSTEAFSSTTSISQMLEGIDYRHVCGKRMYPEPRIVGGSKASFGRWPWQISLRQWRTSTYLHKCGAALLNENWAITAAHCVDNVPPSDLLLRLGEYDLAEEEEPFVYQERRVQIVASHPQFDPRTFEYDLALLRFYEPVVFQPNIIPVCVPGSDENFIGRTAFVTGWGRLYEDGPLPSVLQEVSVPVINNTLCEAMYRNAGYVEHIPHIFICAGWRKGGYDSCEGDSGGPMVIQRDDKRFALAGVISWGIGCAEPNQPGVYTRISEFREWINQILQF